MSDNAAQIDYWNDRAGLTWTAFQERIDAVFAPLTTVALDAAVPGAGERVIDVGCGCGATTLALAARVGPGGQVVGVDVSEPMLARARQLVAAAGFGQVALHLADASSHPFPPGRADLLFSRFGVMFFADPVAAFTHLRRALRPGGRMLCAVWRSLDENPWFTVPLDAARALLPPQEPADPHAPGPFAFADPARVQAIMAAAGWSGIRLTPHDVPMRLAGPGELEQATDLATRVGALARVLAEGDDDLRTRARVAVADALRGLDGPAGFTLPGAIWLLAAVA